MNKTTFQVDYIHKPAGSAGSGSRMKIQGSSQFNLGTAQSDFAVQEYLQKRHPGQQISIISIRWV